MLFQKLVVTFVALMVFASQSAMAAPRPSLGLRTPQPPFRPKLEDGENWKILNDTSSWGYVVTLGCGGIHADFSSRSEVRWNDSNVVFWGAKFADLSSIFVKILDVRKSRWIPLKRWASATVQSSQLQRVTCDLWLILIMSVLSRWRSSFRYSARQSTNSASALFSFVFDLRSAGELPLPQRVR